MKQVIQNYRTGTLELAEVPVPLCPSNKILVKNIASLVSIGTERSVIELGQKSLLGKARTRPDLVKRFMERAKKEGFVKTFKEAIGILDSPTPLGYSSAGIVVEVGDNIHKFSPGDRVSCIGAGYASHAEYITVPENMCCKMKDNLTFEEASFGMLGIIAMHGIRCAKLTSGESVAVIGLGLLGLLSVQILKAYGYKIIGTDIDQKKVDIAKTLGADCVFTSEDDFINCIERATDGYGADAVIITAATKSDAPVNTAVDVVKYGGRVVIVGVADIHPHRNEMWHKEVEIIVSKGGGPGTLDPFYENKGIDYPFGYMRWTENRNLEEFLRLKAEGRINVKPMISHRFKIEQAETVYKDMLDNKGGSYIGVVLEYPDRSESFEITGEGGNRIIKVQKPITRDLSPINSRISLGVIGAGLFGKALLLPTLKKLHGIDLDTIATSSSVNTYHAARKYGFNKCTTDYKEVLESRDINSVIILTPHSMHAKMVMEALRVGKHVFVEKPLCINEEELKEINEVYNSAICNPQFAISLMVGYNRRFSPHTINARKHLDGRQEPMVINYRINAGFVSLDHWVHSEEEGGSRVIGEICHFVDMMQCLTGSNPIRVYAERISANNRTSLNSDNLVIALKFADGSVGNIVYSASGDKAFSREQVEVFCEGKTIVINDYRRTDFYFEGKKKSFKTSNQEIGYKEELQHFSEVIKGKSDQELLFDEIFYSTLTVFKINESLDSGKQKNIELKSSDLSSHSD
ncbi:MAG: bi-domain-containing oxidoreductase [Candidatus Scalinduaceae bacterium]